MTEAEWLVCEDPQRMLMIGTETPMRLPIGAMLIPVGDRKLRLWVEACRASGNVDDYFGDLNRDSNLRVAVEYWSSRDGEQAVPMPKRADLLRDIVGNLFRPAELNQTWRTPTVLAIAQQAYDERSGRVCEECVDGDVGCHHCEGAGIYYDPPCSLNRKKCPHCIDGLLGDKCHTCKGTGRIEDGQLDPAILSVLADALIDAGCPETEKRSVRMGQFCLLCGQRTSPVGEGYRPEARLCGYCNRTWIEGEHYLWPAIHPILAALRSPGPKYRGFWCVDVILGLE